MRISPNPLNPPSSAPNIATMDRPNVAVKNQQIAAPSSDSVTLSNAFQTGKDNINSLGILALGGKDELQSWSGKGLEIADDTIDMAYNDWNMGDKYTIENQGNHELVIHMYNLHTC